MKDTPSPSVSQLDPGRLPVLPLRDVVVYPHMVIPLFVGREKSVIALDKAMSAGKEILLVAQKQADVDDPGKDDVYEIGTLATVLQLLKLPDGTVKVLVEGDKRARIVKVEIDECFSAEAEELVENETYDEKEMDVLSRSVVSRFEQYVKLNKKIPPEILTSLAGIDQPGRLADTVAAHMALKLADKQKVLEIHDVRNRLEHVLGLVDGEIDVLRIEKRIRGRVKQQMEKSQREYYLNEQMKAIQKELGDMEDAPNELGELEQRIGSAGMSKEGKEKATSELNKLKLMSPMSAEATVVRNYIDWLLKVPWKKRTKVLQNLEEAEQVLEEDHYGLEKVKERILEYLAVQQRVKKLKGPILCLVGPPGVGKTSVGQSIARATNRKFVRMSLGGVRDEAEIRGHRRTYIGSMPGKIVQNMGKGKVRNPLFLLDEVDKMSMDFRGDPSSALLEVLDPEQNSTFNDHYLEVDFDLSEVMFVCTANSLNIPAPLLDRMEVIRLPGYTEDEKLNIAKRYLIPKQMKNNGIEEDELRISDSAILDAIRYYTREAGVRNLERELANVCRKVVKRLLLRPRKGIVRVNHRNLGKYLGVQQFRYGRAEDNDQIGQVTGLAWTEVGGELLTIESAIVPGKGKLIHTGQLGDDRYAEAPFAPTESLMLPVIREPGFELQGLDTRAVDADEELDLVGRIRSGLRLPEAGDPALDAELNWFVAHPDYLDRVFSRSQSYLFYIVEALEHRDLPLDLALLPIVESAFDPFAYSHGRAAGLWQIIPSTGRRLGLKQNWWFDARRDVPESTRAALDYLQYLNDLFEGDWLLAVAGYNSGEGNVTRAIRQAQAAGQPTDFWHIKRYLPRETRTYVPRLLALSQLIAAPHAYDLRLPVIPNEPYFTIVETDGQIDMALAAELANLTTEELYRLNPGVNRWATDPDGPHRMLVPVAHASGFATALLDLGAQDRVQWSRHSVQAGDTLGELALAYRTTPSVLRQVNGLGSDMIRIGQNLMVPHAVKDLGHYTQTVDARAERIRDRAREGERGSYVVQAGDSLWSISRRYDVGVRELARWNAMAPGDPLQVGRQLVVWTSKSALTPTPNERIRRLSYTVRKGDSLYLISARFRVSVTELLEWNDLSSDRYLQPGQQLIMYVDVTEQTS